MYRIKIPIKNNVMPKKRIYATLKPFFRNEDIDTMVSDDTITLELLTFGAFNELRIELQENFISYSTNLEKIA